MLADAPYDTAAPVPGCAVSAEDDARSDMAALRAARRRLACNNYRAAMPAESDISRRIGIHQGDIVVEDGDIFGDGVNVAARLEALAEPGGICVSARVYEDAVGRLDRAFEDLGEQSFKNITRPVHVSQDLQHASGSAGPLPPIALALPDKPSIAVLPFQNMSGDLLT